MAAAVAVVREPYDWPVLGDRMAAALFALLEGRLPSDAAGELWSSRLRRDPSIFKS